MNLVTSIALAILGGIFAALAAFGGIRAAWRGLGRRRGAFAALAALAAACTILAQKTSISFDRLISDAGSYATNDVLHVAATNAGAYAAFDFSGSDLLVYRRERGLTNAADWVECLPRRKFGDLPADWHVPDATNYDYLVAVDYVPPSPVHTNGVFELRGFVVPSAAAGTRFAAFATSSAKILPPTAADYIQDGLIAMWDGIENAGWGVHNPNATGPVNLATGLTDSFYKENSSVSFTWGENFLSYSGGWIQFNNLNSAIRYALMTNYKTLQFVGDFQPTNPSEWPSSVNIWSQSGNAQCAFQYRRGSLLAYFDNNYVSIRWDQHAPTVVRNGNSFLYYNKGRLAQTHTGSNEKYQPDINIRCGKITSGTFKVHCIRLYSRALSADEIKRNYEIDKERFNLP